MMVTIFTDEANFTKSDLQKGPPWVTVETKVFLQICGL